MKAVQEEEEIVITKHEVRAEREEITAIVHPEERAMVKEEAMEIGITEQEQRAESVVKEETSSSSTPLNLLN